MTAVLFGPAWVHADDYRQVWLRSVHLGEEVRLQPFGHYGVPELVAWRRLDHLFRSHRTFAERPVNPRLLRTLAQIQRHFGGRRIELLSGYRVPEPGDPLSSYHQVGRAADLYIEGVANRDLYDYCRTLGDLGCGLYPKGTHVHVDVRSRPGTWVDLSRYGEPASYVRDAQDWVKLHPDAGRRRRPRRASHARERERLNLNSLTSKGMMVRGSRRTSSARGPKARGRCRQDRNPRRADDGRAVSSLPRALRSGPETRSRGRERVRRRLSPARNDQEARCRLERA